MRLKNILSQLSEYNSKEIYDRIDYYNKIEKYSLDDNAIFLNNSRLAKKIDIVLKAENFFIPLSKFKYNKKWRSSYFFDSYQYTRFFSDKLKSSFRFGDITNVGEIPQIVKSRPVANNNNSVVLNLDKSHHFVFLNDSKQFVSKKNMLIGRGGIYQSHRIKFYEMYFNNPLCNLGAINYDERFPLWKVSKTSIDEHLDYKFILCLEGNDVASNLKWVMSSNSLAVMPTPHYETWFMEGRLIPNYHYVEIRRDYSDLEEKLNYYINNTQESLKIIENAHKWVDQFKDKKKEDLISLLVLNKYFKQTGQTQ
jgi:hypothetical protein